LIEIGVVGIKVCSVDPENRLTVNCDSSCIVSSSSEASDSQSGERYVTKVDWTTERSPLDLRVLRNAERKGWSNKDCRIEQTWSNVEGDIGSTDSDSESSWIG
jgi:hypothetical protein